MGSKLLLILFVITSLQDIYNYTSETNHVPTLYNVTAILLLQYTAHITLFPTINPLYSTEVLTAVCVQCPVWLFCVVSEHRAFPVCCSGIVWVILIWLNLLLLLLLLLLCSCDVSVIDLMAVLPQIINNWIIIIIIIIIIILIYAGCLYIYSWDKPWP